MSLLRSTSTAALRRLDLTTAILAIIAPELLTDDDSDLEIELENLYRERFVLEKKHARLSFWEPAEQTSSAHDRWEIQLDALALQISEIEDEIQALEADLSDS